MALGVGDRWYILIRQFKLVLCTLRGCRKEDDAENYGAVTVVSRSISEMGRHNRSTDQGSGLGERRNSIITGNCFNKHSSFELV